MKVSVPKGVRDFGPVELRKRKYIFSKIEEVFKAHAYQPIETPTMENLDTLTGKYGEEGDKLLFKVLNNGDFLSKANKQALAEKDSGKILSSISKRGLRYDLTVPFARYVVMNQNEISFPFKRYQIQPVWRADRPQKGRYQEFYQCDVDVVGSDSLMYEGELVQIYDKALSALGVEAKILVNNRKVLEGLAEAAGAADKFMDMVVSVDKLDKIGVEKVGLEMEKRGLSKESIDFVISCLDIKTLEELEAKIGHTEVGQAGIKELKTFHAYADMHSFDKCELDFDITLARGLSYYTGCVFEVKAKGVEMGSIGGGGRYDNLTGSFGLKGVSGVGVSFGAARIYLVMEELGLFPEALTNNLEVLIMALDDASHLHAYGLLNDLRQKGIIADLYPEATKMKKMMKYANNVAVPHVIIIGESERETGVYKVKNMESGEQIDFTKWLADR